jgi:TolB-like protein/DNA-binding winged helix-turn-helix (wHTH) protein/Tfp pilus assembly protein PilF
MTPAREILRFGDVELDLGACELRRHGRTVRLERQPMDLLILLVEHRGQLVSRKQIVDRLWGEGVFVDVDTGVNTAVRKVRQALRDTPEAPVFVETVPGRGYRFIADVEVALPRVATAPSPAADQPPAGGDPPPAARREHSRRTWIAAALLVTIVTSSIAALWIAWGSMQPPNAVTVAVLPFANLSGDADWDYLGDGLAEEMIAAIGQVDPEHLAVVARTSTLAYRATAKSAAEIGRELGADYLLESSLRAENRRLRITAKLIRARDQVQVWSESFDREPGSVLGLQQELSLAIATQIQVRLSPERLGALARRQTQNPDAYDLYLRGLAFARRRTPEMTRQAIDYFTQATAQDPDYALAWAAIANAYAGSELNGDAPPHEVLPRAKEALAHAVRADPQLSETQYAVGYLSWCCVWDWPAAETSLRRALDGNPRLALAQLHLGHALSQMGRHQEARQAIERARTLDPVDPLVHALSSQVAFQARDYPAALDHARQALSLDREFWIGYMMRAQAHEQLGESDLALDALADGARFSGDNSKTLSVRGYVLAKAGRQKEAMDVLATLEALSRTRYVPPYAFALLHAGLGDHAEALDWLERAYEARDVHLIFLTADAKWDPLRRNPRFEALLERAGFRR